jgi:hypothetical protein
VKAFFAGIFLTVALQVFFLGSSRAETPDSGLVEVHYPSEILSSYKERRRTHGANLGINLTQMVPYNWESLLDDQLYSDTYGETPISLISLELGYKFNFKLGSLSLILGYGTGQATADLSGVLRDMFVDKYFIKAMYVMDNLFKEPYIAPYIGGSVWQMEITESEDGDPEIYSLTTGYGLEYSAGLLIQLNWIENWLTDGDSKQALAELGLENTYIDLFVSQHMRAQGELEAPTATDLNYGAGLRLEF